jgi:chemotaxis protein methyltransferase CheR
MIVDRDRNPLLIPAGVPQLLRDLVHQHAGIYYEPDRLDVLIERLTPLAEEQGCYSLLDYYYLLKYEENGVQDWSHVMDALSVPETYFWREMPQIRAFVDILVPKWFERESRSLRVWSAACATGEEPYGIVIALLEAGLGHHPIQVIASDASPAALAKAREGVFREKAFRGLPEALRERYFLRSGQEWQIRPEIAQRVTFQQANLLSAGEISSLASAPFIFCRNVFIYFSAHAIRQTVAAFAARMPVHGHLFIGAAESLLKLTTEFELREIGGAFVYVRI